MISELEQYITFNHLKGKALFSVSPFLFFAIYNRSGFIIILKKKAEFQSPDMMAAPASTASRCTRTLQTRNEQCLSHYRHL